VALLSDPIVVVTEQPNQVVIIPTQNIVAVSAPGPPGPAGADGPPGSSTGGVFLYDRNGVPANPWVIDHGLGRIASVTIVGDDGDERNADVSQVPPYNTLTITFGVPFSGKALVE